MTMDIEQIIVWILKNGSSYPGKHNNSTQRTTSNCKPLEPKAQMQIIWKAFIQYVQNNLEEGKSVYIKKFGSFTFDIETELPRVAQRSISPHVTLEEQRQERAHLHKLRPCFVVDPELQYHLIRYPGKEEIVPAKSQKSIYQKGFRMIYCNPVPIAAACCMGKDVVEDALKTIFLAVRDLIKYDKNLNIAFGFSNVRIINKGLRADFSSNLGQIVTDKSFETTMKRQTSPVSTRWTTQYGDMFNKSTLGTLIQKPNRDVIQTLNEKTRALKIMSLDMSSSSKMYTGAK